MSSLNAQAPFEKEPDAPKSTLLNQILENLMSEILDGYARSCVLSYMNNQRPINDVLTELASKIYNGDDKAKVLKYIK
jgi:hypothetical protein